MHRSWWHRLVFITSLKPLSWARLPFLPSRIGNRWIFFIGSSSREVCRNEQFWPLSSYSRRIRAVDNTLRWSPRSSLAAFSCFSCRSLSNGERRGAPRDKRGDEEGDPREKGRHNSYIHSASEKLNGLLSSGSSLPFISSLQVSWFARFHSAFGLGNHALVLQSRTVPNLPSRRVLEPRCPTDISLCESSYRWLGV